MLPLLSCFAGWLTRQFYCYPKDKWEDNSAAPVTMNINTFCKMLLSPLHPCTYFVSRAAEIPGFEQNIYKNHRTAQQGECPLVWAGDGGAQSLNLFFGRHLGRQGLEGKKNQLKTR